MIQKTLSLIKILIFIAGSSFAQNDSKISMGVVAYQQGDYIKAEKLLSFALEDESKLKQKNIPKGWYYLGMSITGASYNAQKENNLEALLKYKNASLKSYHCYTKGLQNDKNGKYKKLIDKKLTYLFNYLLQDGLTSLNQNKHEDAISYFNAASDINETILERKNYMVYDLRAQSYLGQKDSIKARVDLIQSIKTYNKFPPKNPDLLIAYTYYRLALLARYKDHNLDNALQYIVDGKEILEKEYKRFERSNYTNDRWSRLSQQYEGAKSDLSAFELDILMNSPKKLEEALDKFENAIKEEPNNYIKHVAFASLLERVDLDKSISIYKKAITIDDTKQIAYFNLAAIYINRSVEAAKKSNASLNMNEAKKYEEEIKNNMKIALPLLEKSHNISPKDLGTINALLSVTIQLGMDAEYLKYKKLKQSLVH